MIALDPLLNDIDLATFGIVLAKIVLAFVVLLLATMAMVWFERKVVADMQNRIGPSVAGPWGLFQTLADGIKLFFKEELIPDKADRFAFKLAPFLAVVPAFLVLAVIPLGGQFTGDTEAEQGMISVFGRDTLLQIADPHIGILFVLVLSAIAVYAVLLAGWSSGSKYPLLGSVRGAAQMVSYEAALGLALLAVLLQSGSLQTNDIVASQQGYNWNLWTTGIVPFVVFVIAITAELNRPPFDLVEAEQELVGGFHTEYSALRFAMFFLAEFMNTITMSAVIVTLFLGGPLGPSFGPGWLQAILPTLWFLLKILGFLFMFVWFRSTLPRLRYDQLMNLGWKVLIPVALGWFLLLTALQTADNQGWNPIVVGLVGIGGFALAATLLGAAVRIGRRNVASQEVSY